VVQEERQWFGLKRIERRPGIIMQRQNRKKRPPTLNQKLTEKKKKSALRKRKDEIRKGDIKVSSCV